MRILGSMDRRMFLTKSLVGAIFFGVFSGQPVATQAAPASSLFFAPSTASISVGQQFTLDARINPATNAVSAVELRVTFDRTKVRLDSIVPSAVFPLEIFPASINNTDGTASIVLGVPFADPSVIATSSVALFSFTSLSAGVGSSVAFTIASIAVADGEAGNVIVTRMPATVTVLAPDTTPPTAPGNPIATAVSSSQVNLSWAASTDPATSGQSVSGITGYRIERCQGSGCTNFTQVFTTTTALTYQNAGLVPSTFYQYRVRSIDMAGNFSPYSQTISVTTQSAPDTTAPTAPTNLAAVVTSGTQITLSWVASTDPVVAGQLTSGVTSYRIERCQMANCTNFAQVGTANGTSYQDPGLTGSTVYRYQIRAVDAAGNLSAFSSIASATTFDVTAPVIALVSPIPSVIRDNTPAYVFSTNEVGTIQYAGDCASTTTSAVQGNNTITLSALSVGTHGNCSFTVTDSAGNRSTSLQLSSFVVTYSSDLNLDRKVDIFDFNILRQNYGSVACGNPGDVILDCKTDIFDFNAMRGEYGKTA